jgi:hypothetical protein
VVNSDAHKEKSELWLQENLQHLGLKMGMSSHGYHVSDNQKRIELWRKQKKLNPRLFSRGEMDGELHTMNWSKGDVPRVLYWSGLFSLHMQLDVWNIPQKALVAPENSEAFNVFNTYAPMRSPKTSTKGFCALRKGLDASDTQEFPIDTFGSGGSKIRFDQKRYMDIAKKYQAYGAQQKDAKAAAGGGMLNRNRKGINDVGWGIIPGNYERFLHQIGPDETSQAWWSVDDCLYGRFARSFGNKGGAMSFVLNKEFAQSANQIQLTVTYLDKGQGKWTLLHGDKALNTVRCQHSGKWKKASFKCSGITADSIFILKKVGQDDVMFHLLEVEKL